MKADIKLDSVTTRNVVGIAKPYTKIHHEPKSRPDTLLSLHNPLANNGARYEDY
jgi:hypothetical protein